MGDAQPSTCCPRFSLKVKWCPTTCMGALASAPCHSRQWVGLRQDGCSEACRSCPCVCRRRVIKFTKPFLVFSLPLPAFHPCVLAAPPCCVFTGAFRCVFSNCSSLPFLVAKVGAIQCLTYTHTSHPTQHVCLQACLQGTSNSPCVQLYF